MEIFETAGFWVVSIAAKRHAADKTFCPLFVAVAHCTVPLGFASSMDRDMPQEFFHAHHLESLPKDSESTVCGMSPNTGDRSPCAPITLMTSIDDIRFYS